MAEKDFLIKNYHNIFERLKNLFPIQNHNNSQTQLYNEHQSVRSIYLNADLDSGFELEKNRSGSRSYLFYANIFDNLSLMPATDPNPKNYEDNAFTNFILKEKRK